VRLDGPRRPPGCDKWPCSQELGFSAPKGRRSDRRDRFDGRKERRSRRILGDNETRLREGFEIETHTDTHAIVVEKRSFLRRIGGRGAKRYVVSVDENGGVTMIPAEPKRS
jgi:hypothetical protein